MILVYFSLNFLHSLGRNYGNVKYSEKLMKNQNSKLKNIDNNIKKSLSVFPTL